MKADLYLALVHDPVLNRQNQPITTSVTNLDLHDISRSALTWGVKKFYVVHPHNAQRQMFTRIIEFWNSEYAQNYNPHRVLALQLINWHSSLQSVIQDLKNQETTPLVVTTSAVDQPTSIAFEQLRALPATRPVLLVFGTGNGLAPQVHQAADYTLKPIHGLGEYNHLSVRSAVAVILDRLVSEK